jgi:hypothetical protein
LTGNLVTQPTAASALDDLESRIRATERAGHTAFTLVYHLRAIIIITIIRGLDDWLRITYVFEMPYVWYPDQTPDLTEIYLYGY